MNSQTLKREQDVHLPMAAVRNRYGKSSRTIDRWLADEQLGFPRPLVIRGRRYFAEQALVAWERDQLERQLAKSSTTSASGRTC